MGKLRRNADRLRALCRMHASIRAAAPPSCADTKLTADIMRTKTKNNRIARGAYCMLDVASGFFWRVIDKRRRETGLLTRHRPRPFKNREDFSPLLYTGPVFPAASLPLRGLPPADRRRLQEACVFGENMLGMILRRSGESYARHGREVADVLRELTDDLNFLAAAILHDLLMHPDGIRLLARSPLSAEERTLVRKMHPLRRLHIDANTEDLTRTIDAFAKDVRLLPLRMAHRLNDVRHIDRFGGKLRHQIASETLHMYTAIAGHLGMHAWRREMEDACFRILQPRIARSLEKTLEKHRRLDDACLLHAQRFIARKLRQEGLRASVRTRIKGLYSLYRKMTVKRRSFDEVTDRLALRIIVKDIPACYLALGIVHGAFNVLPNRLKDYIGSPKDNGYRSIHTVVYPLRGVTEQPIEVQIRTANMHDECEFGFARHSEYKSFLYALEAQPSRVNLLRNLSILQSHTRSPEQFEEALRTTFSEHSIAIFDPEDTLHHLTGPLTALDAACQLHDRAVATLLSIRINGRNRPLDTPLRDGDTVETVFGRKLTVQKAWVHWCRQERSRQLLRQLMASS